MKQISNADYELIKRLLFALSKTQGDTVRERENARLAYRLRKKFLKKDETDRLHKDFPEH